MPARFLFLHVPLRISPRMSWPPSNSTLQFRLWGGFGEALRRLGEAFGASELILGGFGRLWETLGEALGRLWETLGELWETLGESLGSLWEALGSFGEVFKAFLLLTPSFPSLYIKKNQTPDQPL